MIDPDLLRKSGWSEELIEAAVKVASQVDLQVQPSGNTEIASSIRNYRRYCNDRLFCRIDARLKLATFLI